MKKKPFVTKEQLEEIVKKYPTPFHLYDEKGIRENAKAVKEAFSWNPGFREYFAVKATPNPYILDILKEYDCGCDCASLTELMLADSQGFALHDEWMQQLSHTTMPTVLFDNYIEKNPNVCYVGTDNYEGIDAAVDHLYTLGHKKIAFLNGSLHSMVSEQRQEAFYNSMKAHGLTVDEKLTAYGYYVADSAKYHVPTFLGAGATAIICGNDLIASGVIAECKLRGFRVPEDISVVGFDDLPLSASLEPPLTTVRQERNELGKCAYVVLNSLVHHIPFCRTQIRARLIERESTARCQAAPEIKPLA